jgi:hypothetical protein
MNQTKLTVHLLPPLFVHPALLHRHPHRHPHHLHNARHPTTWLQNGKRRRLLSTEGAHIFISILWFTYSCTVRHIFYVLTIPYLALNTIPGRNFKTVLR